MARVCPQEDEVQSDRIQHEVFFGYEHLISEHSLEENRK
jgi:hypothetical protein